MPSGLKQGGRRGDVDRVAKGISALKTLGHHSSRTEQILRRYGVIQALNRIAKNPNSLANFDRLKNADLLYLTAEAAILDYQDFFSAPAPLLLSHLQDCEYFLMPIASCFSNRILSRWD